MASPERIGQTLSAAGHIGLIAWVALGGWLFQARNNDPFSVTEVSLISSEEFAAMTAPAAAPKAATETPEPTAPEVEPAPQPPAPRPAEPPPEQAAPEAATAPPAPEAAPDMTDLTEPLPEAEVASKAPPLPLPPVEEPSATMLTEIAPRPKPRDAPRVAPTPAEAPEPDAAPAEEQVAALEPAPADEAPPVEEPKEAAAPPEATTEIVTEATETDDKPQSSAPVTSSRPRAKPKTPPARAEKPQEPKPAAPKAPEKTSDDAIADAVAAAVAGGASEAEGSGGTGLAKSGPPMTSGEKDALRVAVSACWNTGSLSTEALRVTVTLRVTMGQDSRPDAGSIKMIGFEGGSEASARQAFEAARRAVIRCGANGYNLPAEKFGQWKEIEMVFNPEKMRIK